MRWAGAAAAPLVGLLGGRIGFDPSGRVLDANTALHPAGGPRHVLQGARSRVWTVSRTGAVRSGDSSTKPPARPPCAKRPNGHVPRLRGALMQGRTCSITPALARRPRRAEFRAAPRAVGSGPRRGNPTRGGAGVYIIVGFSRTVVGW